MNWDRLGFSKLMKHGISDAQGKCFKTPPVCTARNQGSFLTHEASTQKDPQGGSVP